MTGVSTVRSVLTDAIEGYFRALEKDGYRPEGCSADELADVLLGLSGVAVTQLPEPVGVNGEDNRVWCERPNYVEQEFSGDVIINDRLGIDADDLAHLGAIFLAAARVAGQHQDPA